MPAATTSEVKALLTIPAGTVDDAAIDAIVGIETSLYRAASAVCRKVASFYSGDFDIKSGQSDIKRSQAFMHWMKMSDDFEVRAREGIPPAPVVMGADGETAFPEGQFDFYRERDETNE